MAGLALMLVVEDHFHTLRGESLAALRERCTAGGIPLVHDIDDLVFDPAVIAAGQIAFIDRLPEERRQSWITAAAHRRAIAESDACVVTTAALATAAAMVVPRVHVLPNGLSAAMLAAAFAARSGPKPSALDGRLRVGFASGTPTHHRDFATIAPALADLVAGQIDVMFDGLGSSAGQIQGGALRGLAVAAPKRSPAIPDVPTTAEAGLPGFEVATWYALWAPKGTPPEVVERMGRELRTALASQPVKDAWARNGSDIPTLMGAEFAGFLKSEIARWGKVVSEAKVGL